MLKKTLKTSNEIKYLIKLKGNDIDEYDDEYKIKFNFDYDLALEKTLPMHVAVIVARFVLNDNDKYVCAECVN